MLGMVAWRVSGRKLQRPVWSVPFSKHEPGELEAMKYQSALGSALLGASAALERASGGHTWQCVRVSACRFTAEPRHCAARKAHSNTCAASEQNARPAR